MTQEEQNVVIARLHTLVEGFATQRVEKAISLLTNMSRANVAIALEKEFDAELLIDISPQTHALLIVLDVALRDMDEEEQKQKLHMLAQAINVIDEDDLLKEGIDKKELLDIIVAAVGA